MPSPNDIKKGIIIKRGGDLWVVVDFQRVQPGKGSSFVRTKMKSLSTGSVQEESFKASEKLDFVDVMHKKMQYIFGDQNMLTFMDTHTYEQVKVSRDMLGEDAKYLKEGLEVTVSMHEGKPVSVDLPKKINYTVAQTNPAVKGDTASGNVLKDATADNGLKMRVPIFINEGDVVSINTETGEYAERVN